MKKLVPETVMKPKCFMAFGHYDEICKFYTQHFMKKVLKLLTQIFFWIWQVSICLTCDEPTLCLTFHILSLNSYHLEKMETILTFLRHYKKLKIFIKKIDFWLHWVLVAALWSFLLWCAGFFQLVAHELCISALQAKLPQNVDLSSLTRIEPMSPCHCEVDS